MRRTITITSALVAIAALATLPRQRHGRQGQADGGRNVRRVRRRAAQVVHGRVRTDGRLIAMPTRPICVLSPLVALAAALALSSCGGDDGSTAGKGGARPAFDAALLTKQASSPNAAARSGRIDGSVEIALEGIREFAEPFSASVRGPFQYRKGAALPDYELEMGVRNYGVELSSVAGRSYVSLGETGYAMPPATRRMLIDASARGKNGLTRTLEQFGIAPWRWETDKRFGATERIDGVEVARIDTSFNAGRILKDANTLMGVLDSLGIMRAVGLPPKITRHARRLVVKSVTSKVGASWIAPSDKVIRQSGFTMLFKVATADRAALGGITGGKVVGKLIVTEVGKPQRIKPPATVSPYSDFALALDALAEAQR